VAKRKIKKLDYTIGEVSQITALKAYVLRYWETEFAELKPEKDSAGNRVYHLEDIKLLFLIKKLLYQEKYTIEGARQRLQALNKNGQQMDLSFDRLRQEDALFEVKKGLQDILSILPLPKRKASAKAVSRKAAKRIRHSSEESIEPPSNSTSPAFDDSLIPRGAPDAGENNHGN
jgi:DNA-binding transcriptional MerR regulator